MVNKAFQVESYPRTIFLRSFVNLRYLILEDPKKFFQSSWKESLNMLMNPLESFRQIFKDPQRSSKELFKALERIVLRSS